ncbi:MAG: serine hydrolase domain-containing protein [Candidatus Odinarchaeota archaeon]
MNQKIGPYFGIIVTIMVVVGSITGGVLLLDQQVTSYSDNASLLPVSTPEEQGMDSAKLNQVLNFIKNKNIDSLVVVRNGHVVLEEYTSIDAHLDNTLHGLESKHTLKSCSKSVVASLIGIAIDKGYIESVNQKVVDLFPDRTIDNLSEWKKNLTVEDLLTMRAGYEWWEPSSTSPDHTNPSASPMKMSASSDWTQFMLDQPVEYEPGSVWEYNSGASILLSAIIQQATGMNALDFGNRYLFGPLGITDVLWTKSPDGVCDGGGGLYMTSRDMAKFGILHLNNGSWNGKQIIPAEWVTNSTRSHHYFTAEKYGGYGYQWWTYPRSRIYFASGALGQRIYVIPDYDMVVVFTASILKGANPEAGLLYHILNAAEENTGYSNYGFYFEYPSMLTLKEGGWKYSSNSDDSGQIEADMRNYPSTGISLLWDTVSSSPDLETVLDGYFGDYMAWAGPRYPIYVELKSRGSVMTSMKSDHEMVYQTYGTIEQGFSLKGIVGTWYCEETSRVYITVYWTMVSSISQQGLLAGLQDFLDSLICH